MKDYKKIYQEWLENPYFDEETKKELALLREMKKRLRSGSIRIWSLEPPDSEA